MNICVTCGKSIPKHIWIDGKKKKTSEHRKYCYECSPWGKHNTKSLENPQVVNEDGKILYSERECPSCGTKHNKRGLYCYSCVFKKAEDKIRHEVKDLVGDECWICKYNKSKRSLCFHHVNPQDKKFGLTIREIKGYAWDRVENEIKKCIFICQNCHGEIHECLLSKEEIEKIWKEKWKTILTK